MPSVDEVLRSAKLVAAIEREGHAATREAIRTVMSRLRAEISKGNLDESGVAIALSGLADAVERELRQSLGSSLKRVINATGVILHTNLGRAPLSAGSLRHIHEIASGYSNLEFDVESGERGHRDIHVQRLFQRIFASLAYEDGSTPQTIVVNNCAAAVLLALNTLADGGEVIVSRGELVEIGGAFRVPEIMQKSGGILREVGTTNRTRISDYENAITERTKLLLRVHRSNFAMVGFTEQAASEELVVLGRKHKIPVMEDLGNGLLVDLAAVGVNGEYGMRDSLRSGMDVVCASGDKLLGGPQAGVIAGQPELVNRMRKNPLFRALRVDKLTYAALEATLLAYIREDYSAIPALGMIFASAEEIRNRSESLVSRLGTLSGLTLEIRPSESVIGGGTAPTATLPTYVIAISPKNHSAEELQRRLRAQNPPVIARIEEDRLLLDLRTLNPEDEATLVQAIGSIHSASNVG